MQQITLKWGAIAGVIILGIPLLTYFILGGGSETYRIGEIIGYATIVVSLLMIFAAINEYRKLQPGQRVSFSQGFLIGISISTLAGILFGIYNWFYATFLEPEFIDQYYNYYIEQIRNSGQPAGDINNQIKAIEADRELFSSPLVQFATMFTTVFAIGIIISIFSAAVQSRLKSN